MILINTSKGDIRLDLDLDNTPVTAANFLQYIRSNFYDNTIFHRVIDGFMIQGGGFVAGMKSKACGATLKNEAKNAKKNKRGTIAMARTSAPHSASSQFFINLADNDFLNYVNEQDQSYGYCVFGEVIGGMEVVDMIAKVKTCNRDGHGDVPVVDVIIFNISEEASAS